MRTYITFTLYCLAIPLLSAYALGCAVAALFGVLG
jgi:hypothetical protein